MIAPPKAWAHLPFFQRDWPRIAPQLGAFLPGPERLFAALAMRPDHVRVVILGQDPYPTPGHANGLAFSVNKGIALPRSLSNIYKEMRDDIQASPEDGDLSHLAAQGVLLLNTALSVPPGQAGAHAKLGWDNLARQVIAEAQDHGPLAFLLWGNHARNAVGGLPRAEDLVLASAHPSPLSARRGFFGSRPFSRINSWLAAQGRAPIGWAALPAPVANA